MVIHNPRPTPAWIKNALGCGFNFGDWLQSSSMTAVELNNETIRVAFGLGYGLRTFERHTCAYGEPVNYTELYNISCCKNAAR